MYVHLRCERVENLTERSPSASPRRLLGSGGKRGWQWTVALGRRRRQPDCVTWQGRPPAKRTTAVSSWHRERGWPICSSAVVSGAKRAPGRLPRTGCLVEREGRIRPGRSRRMVMESSGCMLVVVSDTLAAGEAIHPAAPHVYGQLARRSCLHDQDRCRLDGGRMPTMRRSIRNRGQLIVDFVGE